MPPPDKHSYESGGALLIGSVLRSITCPSGLFNQAFSVGCDAYEVNLHLSAPFQDSRGLPSQIDHKPHLDIVSSNHFLIGYFGTLSFLRDPDFILRVFADLKNKITKSKLILMGDVAQPWEKKKLFTLSQQLGIADDVVFTGKLGRNTLQDHLVYCKLSICPIPLDNHYRISSPTKLYESLGNKVPVVANKGIYEHEKVITESKGGLLVDYNVGEFSSAIQYIYENPSVGEKMGEDGKKYVISHYSYQKIAEKLNPYFMCA